MNTTKYMQTDSRWGGLGYPRAPYYIRNCGCGECAICNCIIEMSKYKNQTPATIQPYCKQFADPDGNGTFWSGIPEMMKHYGMTEVKEHGTMQQLWTELAKGDRVAIFLMGSKPGGNRRVHWTSSGHFVCGVDYRFDKNTGKHWLYIKDSYSNSSLRNGFLTYEDNMKNDVIKVWSGKLNIRKTEAYVPKTAYKGKLPTKTVKRGDRGTQVKYLKDFLKWRFNYKFGNDVFGAGTEKAVRNFQRKYAKEYGLAVDGIFGPACLKVAKKIVDKYEKKYGETPQDKMCNWAKKIAGEKYHYVTWVESIPKTHTCPICTGRKYDDYYGWNCIGYSWAAWRHGAGLNSSCSCAVFTDYHYNQLTKMSYDDASAMARQRIGLNDVYLLRDPNGLSLSQLKKGDVIAYFTGSGYIHTALYIGNGLIADCTSGRSDGIKYGVSSYSNYKIKLAFRYTGK